MLQTAHEVLSTYGSEYCYDFEYASVLNITDSSICRSSEYASGSEYVRVLDIPQFSICQVKTGF